MKNNVKKIFLIFFISLCFISCEEFLEVETPDYKLDSKAVFSDDQTAQSALNGLFNQLFNTSYANGGSQSVSFLAALSADNFTLTSTTQDIIEFHQNQISPENNYNLTLWSGSYNIIYQTNALLNGIENNNSLSQGLKDKIEGSSKFIRGLTYFYLVKLYGDVPLILSTNYEENALTERK
ncbi:RagB/SusD family nutrient uptake outer membrane protein, partial [uncultured Salegentibacter sp.]|uniref:RagB/SusD family nutrient uptake outer membrane protein n=1 Tax=uncultured Salegentibacter sp. TaxID=259320 RepID=UPI0030D70964